MLAKVVAHAPTREAAAARLADALARARIHGVRTNRDLLVEVLRHRGVRRGEASAPTSWTGRRSRARRRAGAPTSTTRAIAVAAAVALAEQAGGRAHRAARDPGRLAQRRLASRSAPSSSDGPTSSGGAAGTATSSTASVAELSGALASLDTQRDAGERRCPHDVRRARRRRPRRRRVAAGSRRADPEARGSPTRPTRWRAASLLAPMPGSVVRVAVEPGADGRRRASRCWCSRR